MDWQRILDKTFSNDTLAAGNDRPVECSIRHAAGSARSLPKSETFRWRNGFWRVHVHPRIHDAHPENYLLLRVTACVCEQTFGGCEQNCSRTKCSRIARGFSFMSTTRIKNVRCIQQVTEKNELQTSYVGIAKKSFTVLEGEKAESSSNKSRTGKVRWGKETSRAYFEPK